LMPLVCNLDWDFKDQDKVSILLISL
jgi:hypothetical protein